MSTEIRVKLTIVNSFGKLSYIATPVNEQGEALLSKVKEAVGYDAKLEGGKDRKSFKPEWITLAQASGYKFIVDQLPTLKAYKVGEEFEPRTIIQL